MTRGSAYLRTPAFGDALATAPHAGALAGSAVLFFVYLGFEEIANLAGDAKRGARDLPKAIFISLGVTTLLYVLVSLAAVALVPLGELAGSESAMAVVAGKISPLSERIVSAVALFATANTELIAIIATSRGGARPPAAAPSHALARDDRRLPHERTRQDSDTFVTSSISARRNFSSVRAFTPGPA